MGRYFRVSLVLVLVLAAVLLARNNIAWAGSTPLPASQSDLATLKGLVWNDANQNGLQEAGEGGIANVTVNLYDKAKAFVNAAITDQTGRYQFDGLTPGDYYLDFVAPDGFALSPKDQGKNEAQDSDADSVTGETKLAQLAAGENMLAWDVGMYSSAAQVQPQPGTVKPPPGELTTCENGVHSVGGVSTLNVTNLAPDYCLVAFLRDHGFALGRIPDGAGSVLAEITFLRVFHQGRLVHELPQEAGQIQICYNAPPNKAVKIYFFDFYGPRSGQQNGQPAWQPLETTISGGSACAPAQTSGAYALIG